MSVTHMTCLVLALEGAIQHSTDTVVSLSAFFYCIFYLIEVMYGMRLKLQVL